MNKIMVIGFGNPLLSDEGVGIKVIEQLASRGLPADIGLIDGGTSSFGMLALIKDASKLIIVDAVQGDGPPGTLYEIRLHQFTGQSTRCFSLHQSGLMDTLQMANMLYGLPETVILGIEPANIEYAMELSEAVSAQLPYIVNKILEYIKESLAAGGQ